jgi:hypothetical protein
MVLTLLAAFTITAWQLIAGQIILLKARLKK